MARARVVRPLLIRRRRAQRATWTWRPVDVCASCAAPLTAGAVLRRGAWHCSLECALRAG